MLLGYNTNGLAHHELCDAIGLLADLGYRSVALSIDHGALSPRVISTAEIDRVRRRLEAADMRSVIETGARFLLDPRHKHEPTLISADSEGRRRRIEFYRHAIRCAAELDSDCVSLWSGRRSDDAPDDVLWDRLVGGLQEVLADAAARGVTVGFEPEPGMFVDTLERFAQLLTRCDAPHLGLTLDLGHLQCQGELPLADHIRRWGPRLVNVHVEDMRRGVHEHLMFGEGEMDFPATFAALHATGYAGGVHVELSRHSHEGPTAARRAMEFLAPLVAGASASRT